MMKAEKAPVDVGTLCFRCNLCGTESTIPVNILTRETASCPTCKSNARRRALVRALLTELKSEEHVLARVQPNKEIVGLGMSDPADYARLLEEKFSYQNTCFHEEPFLDIGANELPRELLGCHDFVICSEVLEHVTPPIERAFKNLYDLLKPGGFLLLTVPYGLQEKTIEHFPDLDDFSINEEQGSYILRNVTKEGVTQEFTNLVFHGGLGATLEMRIFAERDLLRHIENSGLRGPVVYRFQDLAWGIWWPEPWAFPITARKPRGAK